MHFSASAVTAVTLCLSAAALSAAPLTSPSQATVLLPESAIGANAVAQPPRLDAAVVTSDSALSIGTQLPQPAPLITPDAPAASLAALVDRNDDDVAGLNPEMRCLASAIFYEARSESLQGKLAVARVVINRSASGRFPTSLCGVVTQPSQFSFVRGGRIPSAPTGTDQWADSVAIARIATGDMWKSQAEGALYFHARRVAPGWGRPQVARIDNHIFYR
ncbi:hypothetical protein BH10PSE13_BH10PSE13_00850 [soil metagenome]